MTSQASYGPYVYGNGDNSGDQKIPYPPATSGEEYPADAEHYDLVGQDDSKSNSTEVTSSAPSSPRLQVSAWDTAFGISIILCRASFHMIIG